MAVAAGPYSSESDLEYTPFANLLQELRSSPPTYVLLVSCLVALGTNHSHLVITARAFYRPKACQTREWGYRCRTIGFIQAKDLESLAAFAE